MPLSLLHITEDDLYKSEPPPEWFGNPPNSKKAAPWTNDNWLKSRFHFSFAEYRNPKNSNFGVLRVMNDDLVQAQRGFGMHGHRDVEIVTYIVEGTLTHQDSMGTRESLGRGSVQFMSAGHGVQHSEHNLEDVPLRFVQIWINTRTNGLEPVYGGFDGTAPEAQAARKNTLAQLVGDRKDKSSAPVVIEQDLKMYACELDASMSVSLPIAKGRQAYVLCVEGGMVARDAASAEVSCTLARHDAAEVRGEGELQFTAGADGAHLILMEMAAGSGGRGPGKWPMHLG